MLSCNDEEDWNCVAFQSPSEVSDVLSWKLVSLGDSENVSIPFRGFRRAELEIVDERTAVPVSIPFRGFRRAEGFTFYRLERRVGFNPLPRFPTC